MSKKYIIALRNSEPAPPEFEYYCGLAPAAHEKTLNQLLEYKNKKDILWDADIECASKITNLDTAADQCNFLVEMGYDDDYIRVFTAEMQYEEISPGEIGICLRNRRVGNILKKLNTNDVDFLKKYGVLDLTKVT
jgi:hypothetical protein